MSRYEGGEGLLELGKTVAKSDRRVIVDMGYFDIDAYATARGVAAVFTAVGVPENHIELVYRGPISHPSSRVAKKHHPLSLPPLKAAEDYYREGNPGEAALFLVDQSGPQSPFVSRSDSPYWENVIGVIDDHDLYQELPSHIPFTDRQREYNAASGIFSSYLMNGLTLTDGDLPTLLLAGIYTDTGNLRRALPHDVNAAQYLRRSGAIDEKFFGFLTNPKLPNHWRDDINDVKKSHDRVNGYAFGIIPGELKDRDKDRIALAADALLEENGITMSAVAGHLPDRIHCSLRSTKPILYPVLKQVFHVDDGHTVGGRPTAGVILFRNKYDGEGDVADKTLQNWMRHVRAQFEELREYPHRFE